MNTSEKIQDTSKEIQQQNQQHKNMFLKRNDPPVLVPIITPTRPKSSINENENTWLEFQRKSIRAQLNPTTNIKDIYTKSSSSACKLEEPHSTDVVEVPVKDTEDNSNKCIKFPNNQNCSTLNVPEISKNKANNKMEHISLVISESAIKHCPHDNSNDAIIIPDDTDKRASTPKISVRKDIFPTKVPKSEHRQTIVIKKVNINLPEKTLSLIKLDPETAAKIFNSDKLTIDTGVIDLTKPISDEVIELELESDSSSDDSSTSEIVSDSSSHAEEMEEQLKYPGLHIPLGLYVEANIFQNCEPKEPKKEERYVPPANLEQKCAVPPKKSLFQCPVVKERPAPQTEQRFVRPIQQRFVRPIEYRFSRPMDNRFGRPVEYRFGRPMEPRFVRPLEQRHITTTQTFVPAKAHTFAPTKTTTFVPSSHQKCVPSVQSRFTRPAVEINLPRNINSGPYHSKCLHSGAEPTIGTNTLNGFFVRNTDSVVMDTERDEPINLVSRRPTEPSTTHKDGFALTKNNLVPKVFGNMQLYGQRKRQYSVIDTDSKAEHHAPPKFSRFNNHGNCGMRYPTLEGPPRYSNRSSRSVLKPSRLHNIEAEWRRKSLKKQFDIISQDNCVNRFQGKGFNLVANFNTNNNSGFQYKPQIFNFFNSDNLNTFKINQNGSVTTEFQLGLGHIANRDAPANRIQQQNASFDRSFNFNRAHFTDNQDHIFDVSEIDLLQACSVEELLDMFQIPPDNNQNDSASSNENFLLQLMNGEPSQPSVSFPESPPPSRTPTPPSPAPSIT